MTRSRPLRLALVAPLRPVGPLPEPEVRITLLQVNDVYTLEAVDEGRRGGFARLATLVKRIRRENPATLLALAGDVISPSVASPLLRGEQMIAGLNVIGLDLVTFGNHELDFGPQVLLERMREWAFTWISANVLDRRCSRAQYCVAAADRARLRGCSAVGPPTEGVAGGRGWWGLDRPVSLPTQAVRPPAGWNSAADDRFGHQPRGRRDPTTPGPPPRPEFRHLVAGGAPRVPPARRRRRRGARRPRRASGRRSAAPPGARPA